MADNIIPFAATHPGEILDVELDARGIKQKDFARNIDVSTTHLNEFIKGKRGATAEFALKLEEGLGIPADMWLRLQSNYELTLAKIRERDKKEQEAAGVLEVFAKLIDLTTIRKEYAFEDSRASIFLSWFKSTFGVESPAELNISMAGLFRKSLKANTDEIMARTWVLIAREQASRLTPAGQYKPENMESITNGLVPILHKNIDTIRSVTEYLSNNGIRFCIVKKVKNAAIDGYSEIMDGVPTIVLTHRYDRVDNFAFSLMHEMGHINLHLGEPERNGCLTFSDKEESQEEREADSYASSHLIPEHLWKQIPETKLIPSIVQRKYADWAKEHNLNKWIVFGRVSHEFGIWNFRGDDSRKVN